MGKKIKTLKYRQSINSIEDIDKISKNISNSDILLVGNYGSINPLAIVNDLKELAGSKLYLEVTAADKNRDSIESAVISAEVSGFDGIVIASGLFNKKKGMGKPVYDLDPAQMLKLVQALKKEKKIRADFQIGVRSPSGSSAADARAFYFTEKGADFLLFSGEEVSPAAADKSIIAEEI